MRVKRIKLANIRAIETAEFRFQPGFNLIIGVNGVGKSTVLDALAACLCDAIRADRKWATVGAKRLGADDIRIGAAALDVECDCASGKESEPYCRVLIHEAREHRDSLRMRQPALPTLTAGEGQGGSPLALFFSTRRAVPSQTASRRSSALEGTEAALAGALASRELRLGEFAAWIRVQQDLGDQHPIARRALKAIEKTIPRFLPGHQNLRLGGRHGSSLLLDRDETTLPVHKLSDGERGVIALVLDLTRRLTLANPDFDDPSADSEVVVLIDELELHLHPRWQRQIVRNLTAAFPRCQFIATTHSPQVIGEVEHGRIHVMAEGEIYSPTYSFGVDSSRVLEELMDVAPRTERVERLLTRISREIGRNRFSVARPLVKQLVEILGENDPEVTRVRTFLDFMEGGE